MTRYTKRMDGGVEVDGECLPAALERLARFEDLLEGLEEEQLTLSQGMEQLRDQGKTKTVQFREMMARKLVNQNVKLLLEQYGLAP